MHVKFVGKKIEICKSFEKKKKKMKKKKIMTKNPIFLSHSNFFHALPSFYERDAYPLSQKEQIRANPSASAGKVGNVANELRTMVARPNLGSDVWIEAARCSGGKYDFVYNCYAMLADETSTIDFLLSVETVTDLKHNFPSRKNFEDSGRKYFVRPEIERINESQII